MQCLPFLSETCREAFSMFPKRKKFQWFRILGMFSVLWHAQHTRVHRNSQKNESIHCNYICKKNFARGWLLRDFTLERVKDWSLTVPHLFHHDHGGMGRPTQNAVTLYASKVCSLLSSLKSLSQPSRLCNRNLERVRCSKRSDVSIFAICIF